jgi:hypothetical protein
MQIGDAAVRLVGQALGRAVRGLSDVDVLLVVEDEVGRALPRRRERLDAGMDRRGRRVRPAGSCVGPVGDRKHGKDRCCDNGDDNLRCSQALPVVLAP